MSIALYKIPYANKPDWGNTARTSTTYLAPGGLKQGLSLGCAIAANYHSQSLEKLVAGGILGIENLKLFFVY